MAGKVGAHVELGVEGGDVDGRDPQGLPGLK